ncbi:MAG: FIST C-terminal domain-containing protein [Alphaproteobacteria bacterium]|nr:FIST C-terminal domain-containing protein [Alphaproteobacteria bacterium]
MSGHSFRAAFGLGDHWGLAAKACLDGLAVRDAPDALGFVYVTQAFAGDLGSIVTFLRETTHVRNWVGGVGFGVVAGGGEIHEGGGISVLLADFPPDSWRLFDEVGPDFATRHGAWMESGRPSLALVHGNPLLPELTRRIVELARDSGCFLVGGLTVDPGAGRQVAGRLVGDALSGVMLSSRVPLVTGLTQGCTPIGEAHVVTESMESVVISLDGRPALDVLKDDVGEILARDLRRVAGYIHAAIPIAGSDTADYLVRNLVGIDPGRGWLAIGAQVRAGEKLIFVRRDPNAAHEDLERMCAHLRDRLEGRAIRGGVYVSCVARGAHMFGSPGAEVATIHRVLGDFPLTGFYANGEISLDRFYAYTGVLTLFPRGDGP